MVLFLDYGDYRGIFAGDAEQETEEAAYQSYRALNGGYERSLASHHGALMHGGKHESWLTATNPQVVVLSAGIRYGHPCREIVEEYQDVQDVTVATHR